MTFARSLRGARWLAVLASASIATFAHAGGNAASALAAKSCAALKDRVDAVAGGAPLFLRSYDGQIGRAHV